MSYHIFSTFVLHFAEKTYILIEINLSIETYRSDEF